MMDPKKVLFLQSHAAAHLVQQVKDAYYLEDLADDMEAWSQSELEAGRVTQEELEEAKDTIEIYRRIEDYRKWLLEKIMERREPDEGEGEETLAGTIP